MQHSTIPPALQHLPDWLPVAVRHYLDHTASGTALRALARRDGVSPSTVLRQVRLCEQRRDDPLVEQRGADPPARADDDDAGYGVAVEGGHPRLQAIADATCPGPSAAPRTGS